MIKNNKFFKVLILVNIFIVLVSCKSIYPKSDNNKCYEDFFFKKKFFKNIKVVELYVTGGSKINKRKGYRKSLGFLNQFVQISYHSMLNYANAYPRAYFIEDKRNWLKWYEQNKCKKIKIKESRYRIDSTLNAIIKENYKLDSITEAALRIYRLQKKDSSKIINP